MFLDDIVHFKGARSWDGLNATAHSFADNQLAVADWYLADYR